MRILVMCALLAALAGCETWSGFKKDVVKGVEAVEGAIN